MRPAKSFSFHVGVGFSGNSNFFVLGALSPGCIVRRAEISFHGGSLGLTYDYGYAISPGSGDSAANYSAGLIDFKEFESAALLGGRPARRVVVPANTVVTVRTWIGHFVDVGAHFFILGLAGGDANEGWVACTVEVVGDSVVKVPGSGPAPAGGGVG